MWTTRKVELTVNVFGCDALGCQSAEGIFQPNDMDCVAAPKGWKLCGITGEELSARRANFAFATICPLSHKSGFENPIEGVEYQGKPRIEVRLIYDTDKELEEGFLSE